MKIRTQVKTENGVRFPTGRNTHTPVQGAMLGRCMQRPPPGVDMCTGKPARRTNGVNADDSVPRGTKRQTVDKNNVPN
ncbi:MAG: hypothetical protein LBD52_06420 [Prevotellaceae bacterium]|nr:hypothetical protein [Prevotellaceae bacterium]